MVTGERKMGTGRVGPVVCRIWDGSSGAMDPVTCGWDLEINMVEVEVLLQGQP